MALVIILVFVSVLVVAHIHTDKEWTGTLLAIVLFKADVALDSA